MQKTYLCHKCSGDLGNGNGLYGCACISGWIRDWQEPVTIEAAQVVQAKARESHARHARIQFIRHRENNGVYA